MIILPITPVNKAKTQSMTGWLSEFQGNEKVYTANLLGTWGFTLSGFVTN